MTGATLSDPGKYPALVAKKIKKAQEELSDDPAISAQFCRVILESLLQAYLDYFEQDGSLGTTQAEHPDVWKISVKLKLLKKAKLIPELTSKMFKVNEVGNRGAHDMAVSKTVVSEGFSMLIFILEFTMEQYPQVFGHGVFEDLHYETKVNEVIGQVVDWFSKMNFNDSLHLLQKEMAHYPDQEYYLLLLAIAKMKGKNAQRIFPNDLLEIENLLVTPLKRRSTRSLALLLLGIIKIDHYGKNRRLTSPTPEDVIEYLEKEPINMNEDLIYYSVNYSDLSATKLGRLPLKDS